MKRHVVILCLLFSLTGYLSYSQTGITYEDVVYLKNGGITRGVILEFVPDQSVKIQTADRNVFVYNMTEVSKITKEPLPEGTSTGSEDQTQAVTDNRPDVARNFLSSKISNESAGLLSLRGFTKTNGVEQNLGQKAYILEYKITVEFTTIGWKAFDLMEGYFGDFYVAKTQPTAYLYGAGYDDMGREYKSYAKGSLIEIIGEVYMEYTDNGWRATEYDNKGSKSVTTIATTPVGTAPGGTGTAAATAVAIPKEPELKCVDYEVLPIEKSLFVTDYPGVNTFRVSLSSMRDNSIDVCGQYKKVISNKINSILGNQNRFKSEYTGVTESHNTKFEITLESVKFEWKAGVSQYDANKSYGGFFCYIVLKSHYYFNDKEIYTNTISLGGGSPSLNDSREQALNKAMQAAEGHILFEIYHCYPLTIKIHSVSDRSNKGIIKEILVATGEAGDVAEDWEFVFYNPETDKTFGKCKLKKLNYDGNNGLCKVTEGEDELTQLLDAGKIVLIKTAY